jgi:DNA-directed RNA polymerase specialized sigma24 family protein
LAEADFRGPEWERLATELVTYAQSVLARWIYDGSIFERCSTQGFRLQTPGNPLQPYDVEDLTQETVARTLSSFKTRVLVEKRWRPGGKARLSSWFVGSCVYQFPNVWRSWIRSSGFGGGEASEGAQQVELAFDRPWGSVSCEDPQQLAVERDEVSRLLRSIEDRRTRRIVLLRMQGHTCQQIADILSSFPAAIGASLPDRKIHLWDLATGATHLWDLAAGASREKERAEGRSLLTALAVGGLVNGHRAVVSGDSRGTVEVWNLDRDTRQNLLVKRDRTEISAVALGHVGGRAVVVSASTWSKLALWDVDSGQQLREAVDVSGAGHAGRRVRAMAVGGTQDCWLTVTVSGDGHRLEVWDLRTGRRHWSCSQEPSSVTAVAVGADRGRPVAVGGCSDGSVRLWDLATGAPGPTVARRRSGVTAVAAGIVNGKPVILSGCQDGSVRLWNADDGREHQVLPASHRDEVVALAMYTFDNQMTAGAVEGRLRRLRRRLSSPKES